MKGFNHRIQAIALFALILLTIFWTNSALASKWKTEIVDAGVDAGWYSSLVLNGSGRPSIAYVNADVLKYAVWNGTAWAFQDIDSSSQAQQPSLFFNPSLLGFPEVTYFDLTPPGSLKYTFKRILPLPMIWVTPETIDTGGVGWGNSLVVDQSGTAKVSYCDFTNNKLKYAHRTAGVWTVETLVDSCLYIPLFAADTSLALDPSGNPNITYWTNGGLKYAKFNGTWSFDVIDPGSFPATIVGQGNAITMDKDGWLHVSYTDSKNHKLKYARHNTTNWIVAPPIDDAQDARTSIAVDDNGGVHICYVKDFDLNYAYNSNKGFSTWVTQTVDGGAPLAGEFCSLKLDSNGKPRIAYFDRTNLDLKFTQALYEVFQSYIKK
ncbi:MAG: hypothetical protein HY892_13990 [Deltaproteobacteria bacterium]|nr:hypothetical protein [Deltaproteobacteria bacterium]